MQLARVVGRATSTVKHASLRGCRLVVAQPLNAARAADGDPQIVIDPLGAAVHDTVIISSDGAGVRQLLDAPHSPARWFVLGLVDRSST